MADWTNEQKAAIRATSHTMLVANAGTGKTTTVVGKMLWHLGEDVGIERVEDACRLSEIAAITFTEKAAYDLKRKLREELRKSPRATELLWEIDRASVGTIHSFCAELLRENSLRLGIDPGFRILDEQEAKLRQNTLLRDIIVGRIAGGDEDLAEVYRALKLYAGPFKRKATIDHARSVMRDMRWHPDRYNSEPDTQAQDEKDRLTARRCEALQRVAGEAMEAWQVHQAEENVRDFDSVILDTRDLLSSAAGEAALGRIRRRYRILIIDEFQDTDAAQRDIAYLIAALRGSPTNERVPQLFLVGDPKQSIYRFRGADVSVWNEVQKDFAALGPVLPLTRNFRSDPKVVAIVNGTSAYALTDTGLKLEAAMPGQSVAHSPLDPARASTVAGAVEWYEPPENADGKKADAATCRELEGKYMAARIQQLVEHGVVIDHKTQEARKVRHSDIAVIYRARTGAEPYKAALRAAGIPLHDHSPAGLTDRQEIHDVVNYLRVLHNRSDDTRGFGLLRSPFIGLRDEVIARIRLTCKGTTLLRQARPYCEEGKWFEAEEHAGITAIERQALRAGLDLLDEARRLTDRVPIDELLTFVLDRSGYRNHLLLLDGHREALGNLLAFVQFCEAYRDLSLGAFIQLWDQRDETDPGLPSGQVFSARDDFVTFSTIHAAKGLEWPIVILADVSTRLSDKPENEYWSDPQFGGILCPAADDCGKRAKKLKVRRALHELAEDARVLYVGMTRARDRLIITGRNVVGNDGTPSFGSWIGASGLAAVGSFDEARRIEPRRISLEWLDSIDAGATGDLSKPLAAPPHRFLTSATELMTKASDVEAWQRKYIDGIEALWFFCPKPGDGAKVSAATYGTLVHGVLERIQDEAELADILEETLGELDSPELEQAFAQGSEYRQALEAEIQQVVRSEEWRWYVEGNHSRELPFIHLAGPREWRIGAFDLYRPDSPTAWIIDFKTHQIGAEKVEAAAKDYVIQADIYKSAVRAIEKCDVRMRLHFTAPNVAVDI